MYRYTVDNAVTYTSEDFVLFRESPFACWMERLTLENPDHGIPADVGSLPPGDSIERQDDMAETLRSEGKNVRLIDWDADEPGRRTATLGAMRKGADFIVNGQLALGPLSGAANLLVRTSGYSELGNFLYIPCETQARSTLHSEFRLCFLADLLHSLQGQLPPQMLIIRGGDDLVPLQTESHIYHYRAVKQRFMEAMRTFRKHRMPDPAESSHFGRWSDCAHEVLKQRLLREEHETEAGPDDDYVEPLRKAVGAGVGGEASSYDLDDIRQRDHAEAGTPGSAPPPAGGDGDTIVRSGPTPGAMTLAEQARMLQPGTYKPGPGVYRLGRPRTAPPTRPEPIVQRGDDGVEVTVEPAIYAVAAGSGQPTAARPSAPDPVTAISNEVNVAVPQTAADRPKYNRRASDAALQNLEFIGSTTQAPASGIYAASVAAQVPGVVPGPAPLQGSQAPGQSPPASSAPAPSLRSPRIRPPDLPGTDGALVPDPVLGRSTVWNSPLLQPAGITALQTNPELPQSGPRPGHWERSAIDLDDASRSAYPQAGLTTADPGSIAHFRFESEVVDHGFGQAATDRRQPVVSRRSGDSSFDDRLLTEAEPGSGGFSNSLLTSEDYDS